MVGYGDLYPTTEISKLFTAGYILVGASATVLILASFGKYILDKNYSTLLLIGNRKNKAKQKKIDEY